MANKNGRSQTVSRIFKDEADSIDIGGYISHRRTHHEAKLFFVFFGSLNMRGKAGSREILRLPLSVSC